MDDAHDPESVGVPLSFDLHGSRVDVWGDADVGAVSGPMRLYIDGQGSARRLILPDAVLSDGRRGIVVADAFALDNEGVRLTDLGPVVIGSATPDLRVTVGLADEPEVAIDLGPEAPPEDQALADSSVAMRGTVHDLPSGIGSYIVVDGELGQLEDTDAIESASLRLPVGANFHAPVLEAAYDDDVQIAILGVSGTSSLEDSELPSKLAGRKAHVELSNGHVRTLEPMRVRQAYTRENRPMLPGEVEIEICAPPTLRLDPGESQIIEVAARETSGQSDAIWQRLELVDGSGHSMTVRSSVDLSVPEAFGQLGVEPSTGGGGGGLGDTPVIDAVTCVLTLLIVCADDDDDAPSEPPPPLEPLPLYLEPGAVVQFEVEITAPRESGRQSYELRVAGQNYEEAVDGGALKVRREGLFR